jgi:tRNA pseudouridine38-40 synthase
MQRYRFDIAYDGTAYAGWQIQPNGITIQATLETMLERVTGEARKVHGSGRTDQGVHARRQVAHVDLSAARKPTDLQRALNALLPPDIRVLRVRRAAPDFHARRSAVRKEYRYCIYCGAVVPPWLRLYRTARRDALDCTAMRRAARMLKGRHDFAAFTANPNRVVESTVRNLMTLRVEREGPDVVIRAVADGFLYKMVRSLAGYLIRVGEGAVRPECTAGILASRTRTAVVPTAPPQGLFLWQVWYGSGRGTRSPGAAGARGWA